jgi:PAS domain S-box-containing protein
MPLGAAQYREVFDRVQDIVYVRNLDGVIIDINEAGARFFGRAKEELIGNTLHRSSDDEQARSLRATNELLLREGSDRSTVELCNASGNRRILEAMTALMHDGRNRAAAFAGRGERAADARARGGAARSTCAAARTSPAAAGRRHRRPHAQRKRSRRRLLRLRGRCRRHAHDRHG